MNYKPMNCSSSRIVIFYKRQDAKGWCHDFCVETPAKRTIKPEHIMQATRDGFRCWLNNETRLSLKLDGGNGRTKEIPPASELAPYEVPSSQNSEEVKSSIDADLNIKEKKVEELKELMKKMKKKLEENHKKDKTTRAYDPSLGIRQCMNEDEWHKRFQALLNSNLIHWRGTHEKINNAKLKLHIQYGECARDKTYNAPINNWLKSHQIHEIVFHQ